jgi:hypothetical protein
MRENIFSLYQEYTKRTEPPPNYHAWSLIGAMSALLGKKCYIPQGHFTVFPNLYIVLVGPAAMRKSTALNIAKNFVRKIDKLPIAPESSTREALIDDMSKSKVSFVVEGQEVSYWQSSAFVGELEQFFGGKHINQQMVGFLTAIWDEAVFKERTRKGGEVLIQNPYFTMLGCCTDEWMNTKLSQDVISDGFSRRTIFVLETKLNCLNPWPESSEAEEALKEKIQVEIARIFNTAGKFTFTDPARALWDKMYFGVREEASKHSPKLSNYFSSKHILVMKVAMCLSAALREDRLVDSATLQLAMDFLADTERRLDKVFSGVGDNPLKAKSNKVLEFISKHPEGITHARVLGEYYDSANLAEVKEIIEFLVTSGEITCSVGEATQAPLYRPRERAEPKQDCNLLELASRTVPLSEPVSAKSRASEITRLIDPLTEQLLFRQKEIESDLKQGILLRGKRT